MPRGGAREGAGAKPKADKGKPQTFTIPPDVDTAIRELADELNISQAKVVARAVRELRERTPRPHGEPSAAGPT